MEDDFEQSLDAQSEFLPLGAGLLGESLVATSEKVYLTNASSINRAELARARQELGEQESTNEFLQVGKWKKAKDSSLSRDLQTVKEQVDQIITQTRWKKKEAPSEELIADESIVPDHDEDEIEDQTQKEEENENEDDAEEEEEDEEEQEDEQEEEQEEEEEEDEEQEEQEEQEEPEEQESQQDEQEDNQEEDQDPEPQTTEAPLQKDSHCPSIQSSQKVEKEEVTISGKGESGMRESGKTDARSQMKRTEYPVSKWGKRQQDPWKRKEAILLRIARMVG